MLDCEDKRGAHPEHPRNLGHGLFGQQPFDPANLSVIQFGEMMILHMAIGSVNMHIGLIFAIGRPAQIAYMIIPRIRLCRPWPRQSRSGRIRLRW